MMAIKVPIRSRGIGMQYLFKPAAEYSRNRNRNRNRTLIRTEYIRLFLLLE